MQSWPRGRLFRVPWLRFLAILEPEPVPEWESFSGIVFGATLAKKTIEIEQLTWDSGFVFGSVFRDQFRGRKRDQNNSKH